MSSSSGGSCTRFKQNAWKKELCSNCYRPKEEHQHYERIRPPKLYIPLKPPSQGILNLGVKNRSSNTSPSKSNNKKKSVRFTKEESEIIGYGGDEDTDGDEDDFEDVDYSTNSFSGYETDECGEDDKALERLTKTNTDFNSVLSNLLEGNASGVKQQQLPLGAKNHKQTLQVSIQPFGTSSSTLSSGTCNSIAASRKSHLHKLLEDNQSTNQPASTTASPSSTSTTPSLLVLGSSPDENDDPLRGKPQPVVVPANHQHIERKTNVIVPNSHEVPIKSIFIEPAALVNKKEERGNPEGRKTHIQRGSVITKSHEQVKNKLYIANIAQKEKRHSLLQDKTNESEDLKTLIIRTNCADFEDQKNSRNLEDGQLHKENNEDASSVPKELVVPPTKLKIESEVTVKVLKLLNGQDGPAESREMAGEPDGKADSDEPETPLTPPPRASFLHRDAVQQHHVPSPQHLPSPLPSPHHSPTATTPTSPLSLALSPMLDTKPSSHSPSATSPSLPTPPCQPNCDSSISGGSSPNGDLPSSPGLLLARCKRPAPKPPTPDLQQSPPPLPPPPPPEPVPRHRRGSSEAVITSAIMAASPGGTVSEKKKTRVRQTLRKLLRLGREDETGSSGGGSKDDEHQQGNHQSAISHATRPRPHIIHPLDLNKSAVQVLPPQSASSIEKSSPDSVGPTSGIMSLSPARPGKPPPPPRSESLNLMERLRPSPNSENNVYANLGEGRCGITPVKPQRTGSLRDQSTSTIVKSPHIVLSSSSNTLYHQLQAKCSTMSQSDADHVYECVGISSAPECDMERQRTSLQYSSAGSETESDIYYPYVTFQNGECKTKLKRRERGVVHSSLEENYGAVVVANYEALSHLFAQMKIRKPILCTDLEEYIKHPSWSALSVTAESAMNFGSITFINGAISKDCKDVTVAVHDALLEITLPDDLQPLVTFSDNIPQNLLPANSESKCNIHVLGMVKLEKLSSYAEKMERSAEGVREGVLILLQAVEDMVVSGRTHYDPNNFVIYRRVGECTPRSAYISLNTNNEDAAKDVNETLVCLCTSLLADLPLSKIICSCKQAKQARSLLQTWLWGPTVSLAPQALRRWLDLERATFLHSAVCNSTIQIQDPSRDLQLKFLVETDIQEIATATIQFTEASNNGCAMSQLNIENNAFSDIV